MKLDSEIITKGDIRDAVVAAGLKPENMELRVTGSGPRARKFNLFLTGSSPHAATHGGKAATWDEWGMVLAALYRVDPDMGTPSYEDVDHFDWVTGARYQSLTPRVQHQRHKWVTTETVATGSYRVSKCECGALLRTITYGHRWSEIKAL